MMDKISKNDIDLLRQPFPLEAHSVHEGPANKNGDKCMWFVYLDKFAIMERLDELFPGEWEYTMTEPTTREKHYSSVGTLSIRGISRQLNGTQKISTESWATPGNDEKGVGTDTFRRAATMWGIGAYLGKLEGRNMWTAKPGKGDWDAEKKAKAEIMSRLGAWLRKQSGGANSGKPPTPPPPVKKDTKQKHAPAPQKQASNGNKAWNVADVEMLNDRIEQRFPGSLVEMAKAKEYFKVQEWSELGSLEKVSAMLLARLYETCAPVKPEYVRHTGKHLEVTVAPGNNSHPVIRIYDRRGKVKDEWLGEFAYHMLGWDNYDDKKTHGQEWSELGADIAICYERNEHGTHIATDIWHSFVDPDAAASKFDDTGYERDANNPDDISF